MWIDLLKLIAAIVLAFAVGKLVGLVRLPAILGWLIAGMALGPYAFGLIGQSTVDAAWYQTTIHVLECAVGMMIGAELSWKKLKKSGGKLIVTTLTQSLGTFAVVSGVFAAVFAATGVPVYLSFVFGGIALATAPAPALSIVREFRTAGPVTETLVPMAALDDVVGIVVFFSVISVVSASHAGASVSPAEVVLILFVPLALGAAVGVGGGFLLRKIGGKGRTLAVLLAFLSATAVAGLAVNRFLLPRPMMNFMLLGMAFSAALANVLPEEKMKETMRSYNPVLGVAMIVVILNLGAPLDYRLLVGAGLYTFVYIASRAAGKYGGAFVGAAITRSDKKIRNYLGLTLLPHSGVSLLFTGIAVTTVSAFDPESATVIQGTIAAAAIINEIVAVIVSKKAFQWAGEIPPDALRRKKRSSAKT